MKAAHQQQVTGNVADTGDQHRNEGHNRITDAPENTAENVVGHDEYRTGRADAGVGHCAGKGVHRGVHDGGGLGRGQQHHHRDHCGNDGKQADAAAYGAPGLPEIALTDALSQQHGHAHGKPCDDNGDGLHDLAAGGHGGDVRRRAEAPHNL